MKNGKTKTKTAAKTTSRTTSVTTAKLASQATSKSTAETTYQGRAKDIARLVEVLQMELERHRDEFSEAGGTNWAAAGDLGCIRDRLIDLVAFASGKMEREDVEAFLADAID